MKREELIFRNTEINDIEAILEVNQHYLNQFNNENGFLVSPLTADSIKESIKDFFSVVRYGELAAYCRIEKLLPYDTENITGGEGSLRIRDLLSERYIYIGQVAVKQNYVKNGIGKFIYDNLFQTFREYAFFSTVINYPCKNTASVRFHESCGFIKAGTIFNDLVNNMVFESTLYYRSKAGG